MMLLFHSSRIVDLLANEVAESGMAVLPLLANRSYRFDLCGDGCFTTSMVALTWMQRQGPFPLCRMKQTLYYLSCLHA